MSTKVLICDDSSFARKQMTRALPKNWQIEVNYAANGLEAIEEIKAGNGDVLFLDLNMPIMDGYQTLEAILKEDLPTMTIVVSGDIQPEAMQRVKELGALEFIHKPVDGHLIDTILSSYGLNLNDAADDNSSPAVDDSDISKIDLDDSYKELANVAMGRAADLLARLLNAFVKMPIPNVKHLEISELEMAMQHIKSDDSISAICQGFIGAGVAGEALMVFNEASYTDIAKLMKYEGEITETVQLELLMDISSVLCNACLTGIADQLDINFSLGHPMVIGQHIHFDDILKGSSTQWKKLLTIEMGYEIENHNINCDLLLLITEDSIDSLNERVSYLLAE